jgi:hypothetical protein
MPFEELHRALVLLCGFERLEGTEVATVTGARILLSRVEPVSA